VIPHYRFDISPTTAAQRPLFFFGMWANEPMLVDLNHRWFSRTAEDFNESQRFKRTSLHTHAQTKKKQGDRARMYSYYISAHMLQEHSSVNMARLEVMVKGVVYAT